MAHALDETVLPALADLWACDSGSNNWSVHGSRTESGKPLVAGDPHRLLEVPNVYYQNHLTCGAGVGRVAME